MQNVKKETLATYEKLNRETHKKENILKEVSEIYTYQITNEHDKIFKDILNDKEEARKFINHYLKLEIPIGKNKLELYNSSYISSLYQNKEADIVYKKTDQNIFFLIEHQSTIDLSMPYRIENYSMEIINIAVDKERMRRSDYLYPKVISIVLYTGHTKWKVNLSFSDVQEKLAGYKEKDKTYAIVDINSYSKKELLEDSTFISKVFLLERSKNPKEFLENAELARKRTPKNKLEQMDKILSVMLTKQIGQEKGKTFLENLKRKGGNEQMMLAVERMFERENKKLIRQGRKEGMEKGMEKGMRQTTITIAKKLVQEGLDINFISKVTGLENKKIEELLKENKK